MDRVNKSVTGTLAKAADGTFILSSASIDRDLDTINSTAIKLASNGLDKLITLWQHKSDQPIGFWENLKMDGSRLVGDLKLASTNLAQMVKQLLDDDVPLGASIGFMGAGQFNDRGGIDYSEIELLECSIVSVPSNRDAIRIAKSFGIDLKSFEENATPASGPSPAVLAAIAKANRARVSANQILRN